MVQPVELLAPAGSLAALHAAVTGGADAVYLGLDAFNARRGADNFTLQTLREACDYAHLRNTGVYVTLNTIVLPREIEEALELARQAYRAGADAFIVQDIGVASELARTLPEARLHLSTQMNIHNTAGIQAAARLGAKRVTLARELSFDEVSELARVAADLGLEVEAFCHGALCVCYSGQCFMSSMIGGRSANRGMCAQACRLPYSLHNKALRKDLPSPGEHLLSPSDLCTIDEVDKLVAAGVSSLKIEGRMKSPEYVFEVTSAYRGQLDRALAAAAGGSPADLSASEAVHQALEEVFSRGFTTAYLQGERGNDIMSYGRPNNRGVFVGRVARIAKGKAYVAVERPLERGDVLEFWTNKGHFSHTVADVVLGKDGLAALEPDRPVGKGDRVFRVRSAARAFEDDALEPRVTVDGKVTMRLGEPLRVEFWRADRAGASAGGIGAGALDVQAVGAYEGPVVEEARTKAVSAEDVRAHIDRLGQTPYVLGSLEIDLDERVGLGFSLLHKARAQALEALTEASLAPAHDRLLKRLDDRPLLSAVRSKGLKIAAWATNPACAKAAKKAGADIVYVPALNYPRGEATVAGQRSSTVEGVPWPKDAVIALPVVEHDPLPSTREGRLGFDAWSQAKPNAPVLVESIGALERASREGRPCEIGPHLPLTNAFALQAAGEWGAARAWLSPELTIKQIADLAEDSPVELGIAVSGFQELMITEHCLLMSQGPCDENCDACPRRKSPHYLKDRKGYEFPVVTDALGRSHLYNSVEYDGVASLLELIGAGIGAVMVDATLMTVEQTTTAVKRLVRARSIAHADGNAVARLEAATTGHLYRGVS
ncbi:U32 family peptidase [Eggerthellaceae bacterium zg-893]|nr:U32 family peptidase [Eggerthellaceae bacterium zg-893]